MKKILEITLLALLNTALSDLAGIWETEWDSPPCICIFRFMREYFSERLDLRS